MGRRRTRVPNPKFSLRGVTHFSEFRISKGTAENLPLAICICFIPAPGARASRRRAATCLRRLQSKGAVGLVIAAFCRRAIASAALGTAARPRAWMRSVNSTRGDQLSMCFTVEIGPSALVSSDRDAQAPCTSSRKTRSIVPAFAVGQDDGPADQLLLGSI